MIGHQTNFQSILFLAVQGMNLNKLFQQLQVPELLKSIHQHQNLQ